MREPDGGPVLPMHRVVTEKALAAEKRLAAVRLWVIASGVVTYPLLLRDAPRTIPGLAYALLGLATVYGVYVYLAEPYRRHPVLRSSYFTSATDSIFTMLWLYATGGV